jgi:hypothetical protein
VDAAIMIALLSDHDIELHARLIRSIFTVEQWRALGVASLSTLIEAGLDPGSSDRRVWEFCQAHDLLLLTGNRNIDGPDSLGQTIEDLNAPSALPVLTIGVRERVLDAAYREDCAYRIADIVSQLDRVRGTGRLFIP